MTGKFENNWNDHGTLEIKDGLGVEFYSRGILLGLSQGLWKGNQLVQGRKIKHNFELKISSILEGNWEENKMHGIITYYNLDGTSTGLS